jgi:hypothetical protein
MIYLILIPLVLYCCLPREIRAEIDDWARLLVGLAIGLAFAVWAISLVFQLLFGAPAMDNMPEWN